MKKLLMIITMLAFSFGSFARVQVKKENGQTLRVDGIFYVGGGVGSPNSSYIQVRFGDDKSIKLGVKQGITNFSDAKNMMDELASDRNNSVIQLDENYKLKQFYISQPLGVAI